MKNGHWPFSSLFLGLYHCARDLEWKYNDKPVTIAWLFGFYSGLIPNTTANPFRPNSLAWNQYMEGFGCHQMQSDKYQLKSYQAKSKDMYDV